MWASLILISNYITPEKQLDVSATVVLTQRRLLFLVISSQELELRALWECVWNNKRGIGNQWRAFIRSGHSCSLPIWPSVVRPMLSTNESWKRSSLPLPEAVGQCTWEAEHVKKQPQVASFAWPAGDHWSMNGIAFPYVCRILLVILEFRVLKTLFSKKLQGKVERVTGHWGKGTLGVSGIDCLQLDACCLCH